MVDIALYFVSDAFDCTCPDGCCGVVTECGNISFGIYQRQTREVVAYALQTGV